MKAESLHWSPFHPRRAVSPSIFFSPVSLCGTAFFECNYEREKYDEKNVAVFRAINDLMHGVHDILYYSDIDLGLE